MAFKTVHTLGMKTTAKVSVVQSVVTLGLPGLSSLCCLIIFQMAQDSCSVRNSKGERLFAKKDTALQCTAKTCQVQVKLEAECWPACFPYRTTSELAISVPIICSLSLKLRLFPFFPPCFFRKANKRTYCSVLVTVPLFLVFRASRNRSVADHL